MAENVRVIVRCRPMNRKEQDMKCKDIIRIDDCAVHLAHGSDATAPPKTFTFDAAYAGTAGTEALYNDLCYSLVDNVLDGYNGTIFAYGQTGCGKSHTMQGPDDGGGRVASAQRGIIQRSFDHIFEAISVATGRRYLAQCSYLEIYNENVRDLLEPATASALLQLKELPGEGVTVANLSQHTVHTAADCERLLAAGARNRIVAATLMNATSSRSHSIFTVSLEQIVTSEGGGGAVTEGGATTVAAAVAAPIRKGKLNLVDLAGSERQTKTGAAGDRLKEATKINLSLSALGNVISALVDGRRTKHVPYRDSRLTRLLQDSLGGNTKTLMVACVSPAAYNYDETLSTLRYASRAKCISNKPRINEDPKEAALREYQAEIVKLRQLLAAGGGGAGTAATAVGTAEQLERERRELRERYEADADRLRREFASEQREKEELREDMVRLRSHYEQQMAALAAEGQRARAASEAAEKADANNNGGSVGGAGGVVSGGAEREAQAVRSKVATMRGDLIGGERANDVQLRERHRRKKADAERRMSALGHALARLEHAEERDLLTTHYTDISDELRAKTEALRAQRQRVRTLERDVSDVQAEFELDRADYLETIRRLQKRVRFYEQLTEKALPLLRRDGRFWDPAAIRAASVWNDDLGRWRIPEQMWGRVRLPPAGPVMPSSPQTGGGTAAEDADTASDIGGAEDETSSPVVDAQKLQNPDDIAGSYFRPRGRAAALIAQPRGNAWKAAAAAAVGATNGIGGGGGGGLAGVVRKATTAQKKQLSLSRTWCGPATGTAQMFQSTGALTSSTTSLHDRHATPFLLQPPMLVQVATPPPPPSADRGDRDQRSPDDIADGDGGDDSATTGSGGGRFSRSGRPRPHAASTRGHRQRSFVT